VTVGGVKITEQRVVYAQRKGLEGIEGTVYAFLYDPDQKIYTIRDPKEVLKIGLCRMNPHILYVFGDNLKLFENYLKSFHPELLEIFIRSVAEDSPKIIYQDDIIKRLVFYNTLHDNPDTGIFIVESGRLRIKRMSNKESMRKLEYILHSIFDLYESKDSITEKEIKEVESVTSKFAEVNNHFEQVKDIYGPKQNDIIHPDDPEGVLKRQKMEELKNKLQRTTPLIPKEDLEKALSAIFTSLK
jgi:hypothetical protein